LRQRILRSVPVARPELTVTALDSHPATLKALIVSSESAENYQLLDPHLRDTVVVADEALQISIFIATPSTGSHPRIGT